MKLTLKFKKLLPTATIPRIAKAGDSGMDVTAAECATILPHSFTLIHTGIAAQPPKGYELQVRPRSGLMCKKGVVGAFGTVDNGYRGDIGVALYNHTDDPFIVNIGDRIAQLVLSEVPEVEIVEASELDDSERGADGFGSTGM